MKQDYKQLFDGITPIGSDEEFTVKVIRKAKKMQKNNEKKRFSLKRPMIAVCAAALTLTLGVTTAAAAGVIEFDRIFGNFIKAENEQLGDKIMGSAENLSKYVSDNNYDIRLNGITGNDNMLIANLEIYRVDGTPVTEHFVNPYNDKYGFMALDTVKADMYMDRENWIVNMNKYFINENGNLEIHVEVNSDLDISEKKITLSGKELYPIEPYCNFLETNGVSMWTQDELKLVDDSMNEVTLDTSSVVYLPIEWNIEFEYHPSEMAVNAVYKDDFSAENKILLEYSIGEYLDEGKFVDIESEIVSVDLKPTNGTIVLKSCVDDYVNKETNRYPDVLIGDEGNDVKLIKKDGTEISAFVCGAWYEQNDNLSMDLVYLQNGSEGWYSDRIAIDLSQIKAISINGYEYGIE